MSQIIPYADNEHERLSGFGRKLLRTLSAGSEPEPLHLHDDVEMEFYRLQLISSGAITLGDDDPTPVASPTAVGTGNPEDPAAPLAEIIEQLNARFGSEFTYAERLFFEQIQSDAIRREDIQLTALTNTFDKFSLGIWPHLEKLMIERIAANDELVTRCLNDREFQEVVFPALLRAIFDKITTEHAQAATPDH